MQESPLETIHPVALFYSYAPEDEAFRLELEKHLSVLRQRNVISEWHTAVRQKIDPSADC